MIVTSLSYVCPWISRCFISFPPQNFLLAPKTLPYTSRRNTIHVVCCSSPNAAPATEQDILKFVAHSDGKSLPCVRTYDNDLAQLSLVGSVEFEQALTAAAADGGIAASKHLRDRLPVMVVETLFPGGSDPHATVSTRLFLPTQKVKEKAKKLKRSLAEGISTGIVSENILAMTFRQVVFRKLWKLQLVLFRPGTIRDMEELQNPREVAASFSLSSSNEKVTSAIAEVLCAAALQSTERHFLDNYLGKTLRNPFQWFQKHETIASKDSSVVLCKLFDEEIVENAVNMLEHFQSMKENFKRTETGLSFHWCSPSTYSKLEKIGGPGFSDWSSEYVITYRLVVDPSKFEDLKFEGWRKSIDGRLEVPLTHLQLVGLADILDMYYEDIFSLPDKRLLSHAVVNYADLSSKKRGFTLLKIICTTAVSAVILVAVGVLGRLRLPSKGGKYLVRHKDLPSSKVEILSDQSVNASELEKYCALVVKKVKTAFGWPGEITTVKDAGAWIGGVPDFLKATNAAVSSDEDNTAGSAFSSRSGNAGSSFQDVASFKVVLSTEGKVVDFQPTNQAGVNHWAENPLARELHGGKKLSPGFFEPGLKQLPDEVVEVELLMSVNLESRFAFARLVK